MESRGKMKLDKIAVVGSVVNSKDIDDRNNFQIQLKILLESINERYRDDIAAKFRITLGDEFQGLLHNTSKLMLILDEINLSLFPFKIRLGIGVGGVDTTSSILSDEELDGSAYWNAREALNRLTKDHYYNRSLTYCYFDADDALTLELLNSLLELQDTIRLSWTSNQSDIIEQIIKSCAYESFIQKDLAASLSLSPQRLSNVFAASSFKQYAKSRKIFTDLLRSLTHCIEL